MSFQSLDPHEDPFLCVFDNFREDHGIACVGRLFVRAGRLRRGSRGSESARRRDGMQTSWRRRRHQPVVADEEEGEL